MGRTGRRVATGVGVAAAVALFGAGWVVWRGGDIVSGYTAKILCSCVFVSDREPASCVAEDLAAFDGLFEARVDRPARAAESTALLVRRARAVFHDGLGCTLE